MCLVIVLIWENGVNAIFCVWDFLLWVEIASRFSAYSRLISKHFNTRLIFPAVLAPLIVSHINILRDKIPSFPVKGSSSYYRDLWYLVKFTMQDRKSIAKEAGYEKKGPVSVRLSSASLLMSSESPVSHSLWQKLNSAFPKLLWCLVSNWRHPGSESHRWQTPTATGAVPQQTPTTTCREHLRHPHWVALPLELLNFLWAQFHLFLEMPSPT